MRRGVHVMVTVGDVVHALSLRRVLCVGTGSGRASVTCAGSVRAGAAVCFIIGETGQLCPDDWCRVDADFGNSRAYLRGRKDFRAQLAITSVGMPSGHRPWSACSFTWPAAGEGWLLCPLCPNDCAPSTAALRSHGSRGGGVRTTSVWLTSSF